MVLDGFQLHITHTKFRENYTTGSEVEIRGQTDTRLRFYKSTIFAFRGRNVC